MKKLIVFIFLFISIFSFGQYVKPISPTLKPITSPAWMYDPADSTIQMYKGNVYLWNKFLPARTIQHKIDSIIALGYKLYADTTGWKGYFTQFDALRYRLLTNHDSLSTLQEKNYSSLDGKPDLTVYKYKNDSTALSGFFTQYDARSKLEIPLNNVFIPTKDYAGNDANLIKLSADNIIEFGGTVGINAFHHVQNPGFNDIVNIPVNSDAVGKQGVGITIGGTRVLDISVMPDGSGGVIDTLSIIKGIVQTRLIENKDSIISNSIKVQKIKFTTGAMAGYIATSDADGDMAWASPVSSLVYKGSWNASTNTPTLSDATGTNGWIYAISVTGTRDLGSGSTVWTAGGFTIHNGTIWEFIGSDAAVSSVNALTGAVVITPTITGNSLYLTGNATGADISATTAVAAATTHITNDGDLSGTNELQTISTTGAAGNITLSNSGGTLNLNVNDADYDPVGEIQTLSIDSVGRRFTVTLNKSGGTVKFLDTNTTYDLSPYKLISDTVNASGYATVHRLNGKLNYRTFGTAANNNTEDFRSNTWLPPNDHVAATVTTENGLSISAQQISLQLSSNSTHGALSDTDWRTFNDKQAALVSGTNIKTVNLNSLVGSGNVSVGTVTGVSVTTANGISGSVTSAPTPAITLALGAITPTSVNSVVISGSSTPTLAVAGTSSISGSNTGDNAVNSNYSGLVSNATHTGDAEGATALVVKKINGVALSGLATGILKNTTGTGTPSIAVAADFPTLNQNTTGNAATATNVAYSGLTGTVPTWNQNTTGTSANVTGVVLGTNGGTGIANTGKTITLGGNLTTSGAFASTFTMTGTTGVTFPTSGTLATTSQITGTNSGTNTGDQDLTVLVPKTTTITATAPLTIAGTTSADLSTNRTISITQSGTGTNGYLSSTDWNTFNNKQPAGSYLVAADISGKKDISDSTAIAGYTRRDRLASELVKKENVFTKNTGFNKNFGSTTGTVLEGRTFGTAANSATTDFEVPLTFSDGLLRTGNSIVNTAKKDTLLNNVFLPSYDYAGNLSYLLKYSADNIIEFGGTVGINAFHDVANSGFHDIVNIPVNSDSPSGTEHGVGISIGGNRVFSAYAVSDGSGGIQDTTVINLSNLAGTGQRLVGTKENGDLIAIANGTYTKPSDLAVYRLLTNHDSLSTLQEKNYSSLDGKPDLSSLHASGSDNQTISKVGQTVTLSGGGGGFTDDNTTYSAGTGLTLTGTTFSNTGIITEVDGSTTNEIQDLSLSGNTLSLSGDATTVDLSAYVNPTLPTDVYGEIANETPNSVLTAFTIDHSATAGTVRVYLNGIRQTPTTHYSVTGATITFVTTPTTGDIVLADYKY